MLAAKSEVQVDNEEVRVTEWRLVPGGAMVRHLPARRPEQFDTVAGSDALAISLARSPNSRRDASLRAAFRHTVHSAH